MEDQLNTALGIYQKLLTCNLATSQIASDENIDNFQQILNSMDFASDMVKNTKNFIKCLYDTNKSAFYNYLKISGQQYLTLFTNGGPIAKMLNVHNLVLIKYQWQQQNFRVSKMDARNYQNNSRTIQLGTNKYPVTEKKKRITRVQPGEYEHMYVIVQKQEPVVLTKSVNGGGVSILSQTMMADWGSDK